MNTLDRRKFIKDMTLALAGSTAGLTIGSCSLIRAGYREFNDTVYHDKILKAFQKQTKTISESRSMQRIEEYLQKRKSDPYMIKGSIISLMAVGTFGDLPEEDRKHPAMQQMITDSLPVMDRAVLSSATYLEQLSAEEREGIQETIKEHPEILTAFQVEFDKAARKNDIPASRLDHFNALFNKCVWRLENQDPSDFIDELVTLTDKSFQKVKVTPDQRREWGSAGTKVESSGTSFQAQPADSLQSTPADIYRMREYERWKEYTRRGNNAVIWGIAQFGIGYLLASSSDDALEGIGALGLFVGMTGGAIIVIVGIIMSLVGTVKMSQYD